MKQKIYIYIFSTISLFIIIIGSFFIIINSTKPTIINQNNNLENENNNVEKEINNDNFKIVEGIVKKTEEGYLIESDTNYLINENSSEYENKKDIIKGKVKNDKMEIIDIKLNENNNDEIVEEYINFLRIKGNIKNLDPLIISSGNSFVKITFNYCDEINCNENKNNFLTNGILGYYIETNDEQYLKYVLKNIKIENKDDIIERLKNLIPSICKKDGYSLNDPDKIDIKTENKKIIGVIIKELDKKIITCDIEILPYKSLIIKLKDLKVQIRGNIGLTGLITNNSSSGEFLTGFLTDFKYGFNIYIPTNKIYYKQIIPNITGCDYGILLSRTEEYNEDGIILRCKDKIEGNKIIENNGLYYIFRYKEEIKNIMENIQILKK